MAELLSGIESEVARRMVHASGSLVPLGYLLVPDTMTWQRVQWLLVLALVCALALEFVRLVVGLDWAIYDHLTRSYEQDNVAGYALAIISVAIVVWAATPEVAVPAILMLTLGDPISGLLGSDDSKKVGKEDTFEVIAKPPRVLGVMFVVCTAIAFALLRSPVPAVLGGLAAMAADGYKPIVATFVIDDNLTIPLAGAAAMTLGLLLV